MFYIFEFHIGLKIFILVINVTKSFRCSTTSTPYINSLKYSYIMVFPNAIDHSSSKAARRIEAIPKQRCLFETNKFLHRVDLTIKQAYILLRTINFFFNLFWVIRKQSIISMGDWCLEHVGGGARAARVLKDMVNF